MKCAIVKFKDQTADATTHWWVKRKVNLSGVEIPYAHQNITLCVMPYTMQEMTALAPKKQRKIWDKAVIALLAQGVRCVYLPQSLIEYGAAGFLERDFLLPSGEAVFAAMIPAMLRKSAATRGIELTAAEAGIWQSRFDAAGHAVFAAIADIVRHVTLYTEHAESAQRYADAVYEQCGLSANITLGSGDISRCDAVILIDTPPNAAINEQCILIDASGKYRKGGINSIVFTVPFGFSAIGAYVDRFDQRTMAFMLTACGANTQDIAQALKDMGCGIGNMRYSKP